MLYAINASKVQIGTATVESKPGTVTWQNPVRHTIQNLRDEEARFLMVELKNTRPQGTLQVQDDDGTKVAPEVYRLLFENDRVRVIEIHITPGQKAAMHSHPGRAFRYRMATTLTRVILPDGKIIDSESREGTTAWTEEGSRHALENIGTTTSRTLVVELK